MSELATDQAVSTDDWAAALNEQNAANADVDAEGAFEQAAETRAPNPAVFEQFSISINAPR